jgi:hypothetical protein
VVEVSNATAGADADEDLEAEVETPDHPDPKEITRKPASLSSTLAIVAAATTVLLAIVVSHPGAGAGVLGLAALATGVAYGYRGLVDAGGLGLLLSTVLVGFAGVEYVALLSAVATVVAWDVGNNAIDVGEQLGREAETQRIELLHAGATAAVGLLTAGVSYGIYQTASSGQPVTAVFFLLLAALALISSLRL